MRERNEIHRVSIIVTKSNLPVKVGCFNFSNRIKHPENLKSVKWKHVIQKNNKIMFKKLKSCFKSAKNAFRSFSNEYKNKDLSNLCDTAAGVMTSALVLIPVVVLIVVVLWAKH